MDGTICQWLDHGVFSICYALKDDQLLESSWLFDARGSLVCSLFFVIFIISSYFFPVLWDPLINFRGASRLLLFWFSKGSPWLIPPLQFNVYWVLKFMQCIFRQFFTNADPNPNPNQLQISPYSLGALSEFMSVQKSKQRNKNTKTRKTSNDKKRKRSIALIVS